MWILREILPGVLLCSESIFGARCVQFVAGQYVGFGRRLGVRREGCFDRLFTATWAIPTGCLEQLVCKGSLFPSSPSTWIISRVVPGQVAEAMMCVVPAGSSALLRPLIHFCLPPPALQGQGIEHTEEIKQLCEPTPT